MTLTHTQSLAHTQTLSRTLSQVGRERERERERELLLDIDFYTIVSGITSCEALTAHSFLLILLLPCRCGTFTLKRRCNEQSSGFIFLKQETSFDFFPAIEYSFLTS